MKYFVNEGCIGSTLCTQISPDIFSMNEQGFAVAQDIETTDVAAQEAKEGCPVGAIEEV